MHSAIIVGAGFSGTMLALELAERGVRPLLVDTAASRGRGIAYGTGDRAHLLNVPAAKMGAWADAPGDFAERTGREPTQFAERHAYGDYLKAMLDQAIAAGVVEFCEGRARSASRQDNGWRVELDDGRAINSELLALATGNGRPAPFEIPGWEEERIVQDPWSGEAQGRLAEAAANGWPVLLIGTGLTMVDLVLTLDRLGHRAKVTAVSRRGLIPKAHRGGIVPLPPPGTGEVPEKLSDAVAWLRARGLGVDWRSAVDSLRPITQALWAGWPDEVRARFLRHARPWWDVHRHRIAPEAAAVVERDRKDGRLDVRAGRIREGKADGVTIDRRGGGEETVPAALAVNCTGPNEQLEATRNPLLRQMLADGLLAPGPMGIGSAVNGAASAGERLWALGPLTKGQWWEITAVPDIRVQVGQVAEAMAGACQR